MGVKVTLIPVLVLSGGSFSRAVYSWGPTCIAKTDHSSHLCPSTGMQDWLHNLWSPVKEEN